MLVYGVSKSLQNGRKRYLWHRKKHQKRKRTAYGLDEDERKFKTKKIGFFTYHFYKVFHGRIKKRLCFCGNQVIFFRKWYYRIWPVSDCPYCGAHINL